MFRVEAEHFWFVGTRRVIVDVLEQALGSALPGARVLDLGCGTGYTLTRLPSTVRAVGLDYSETALGLSSRRDSGASLVRADATRLPFRAGSFDAVLALDVLEHLDADGRAAAEIRRILKPSGVAIVTVPAFRWLWSGHDEALDHRRRYTLPEISEVLRDAGLLIERASYYNFWLFPPIAALRALERLRPRKAAASDADVGIPPAPLNRALAGLLGSERHLVTRGSLPFGVSCLVTARVSR
jgi:SAM-dependent methyltransferase